MEQVEYELRYDGIERKANISTFGDTEMECWEALRSLLDQDVRNEQAEICVYCWEDVMNKDLIQTLRCNAWGQKKGE